MNPVSLDRFDFADILACFRHAFSDYAVQFDFPDDYWRERWRAGRVQWDLSFGIEDEGQLVAMMLHGIDHHNGLKTAFNGGTGVIPDERGNRLVKKMYEFCLPILKANGVKKCMLEVITTNEKAIRAYQSVGFQIKKRYLCFKGKLKLNDPVSSMLKSAYVDAAKWDSWRKLTAYEPCWECNEDAINLRRNSVRFLECTKDNQLLGYAIFDPANGYIYQLGYVEEQLEEVVPMLLNQAASNDGTVRINNIPDIKTRLCNYLESNGIARVIDQYEMTCLINGD